MRLTITVAVALSIVNVAIVRAEPDRGRAKDELRARNHYEAGRALYDTGNYDEAMREFALGFELVDKPEFVLNIGLCHYRLGHWVQARENYLRFLQAVPADHPRRKYAEERLAEVDKDLAEKHAPATVETPPAKPLPVESALPPSPPPSASTTALTLTAERPAPAPRKSWMRRNWWVIPVVTVAAAGVAVGLAVGLTRNDPCAGAGACVALPP